MQFLDVIIVLTFKQTLKL